MKRCGYCRKLLIEGQKSYCSDSCRGKAIASANRTKERNAPKIACIVCGKPTQDGALYCSRACEIEQQVRTFGAPIADFLIDRGRFMQDTDGQPYARVLEKHGLYKLAG